MANAEVDGVGLSEWEIIGFNILLLIAGNETTTNLLGNLLNVLADRPDLWERLRREPELIEAAIEETLRFDSPVQFLMREAKEDVDLHGERIAARESVIVVMGSANRDAAVFDAPDEYRLDRTRGRHLSFGYGIHFCIGAPLARIEARVAMRALLASIATRHARQRPHASRRFAPVARLRSAVAATQRLIERGPLMQIDLLSPASFSIGHPHDQYRWLREHAPVYWHEEPNGPGFWAVTRFEDVRAMGRDPETFSSEPTIMIPDPPEGGAMAFGDHKMMLMMDPPQHTAFRRLISREFTQAPAAALRPRVEALARQIVDLVIERGECDFVADIAGEMPSYVIAELMGHSARRRPQAVSAHRNDPLGARKRCRKARRARR